MAKMMNDPTIPGDLVKVFPLILQSSLTSYRNIICDVGGFFPFEFKSNYYENNDKWNSTLVPKYFCNMGKTSVPIPFLK